MATCTLIEDVPNYLWQLYSQSSNAYKRTLILDIMGDLPMGYFVCFETNAYVHRSPEITKWFEDGNAHSRYVYDLEYGYFFFSNPRDATIFYVTFT